MVNFQKGYFLFAVLLVVFLVFLIIRWVRVRVAKGRKISVGTSSGEFWKYSKFETYQEFLGISMGTSSGEFWKYSKFETYQEFLGIYGN